MWRKMAVAAVMVLAFAGCQGWTQVEKGDKRGGGTHSCRTIWVPERHEMRP